MGPNDYESIQNHGDPPDLTASAPLAEPEAEAAANQAVEFVPLDPAAISLWRIHSIIGSAILLGLAALPVIIVGLNVKGAWPWALGAWLALAALRLFLLIWYPPRLYRSWGYAITEHVLEMKSGVVIKVTRLLPLNRLQHVDLRQGPIERYFGLSTLMLHTAGTHQAVLEIPGLDQHVAKELRDKLVTLGGADGV